MKRITIAVLAIVFTVGFSGTLNAKKMNILNFDKGGMPSSKNNVEVSLAENKAPKGQIYLKMVPIVPGELFWCGEYQPKKAVWDGFDVLKFDYFNEDKNPVNLQIVIKPKGRETYQARFDSNIVARPGKGSVEIELIGSCGNDGNIVDWKTPVAQWNISGKLNAPLHIGNVTVETLEDEKDKK